MFVESVEGMVKDTNEVDFVSDDNRDGYNIHDLLLPLPGYDVLYPRNEGEEVCVWSVEMLSCVSYSVY